ncbi:MAG: serine/threonine protein kinase [Rhodocyclaceae bacterium]|nr:MAG: serine/threonine protein kinase [Rhodocyclaceae bacterium]
MSQTIGRFEIRRELGRGAQSVVYLAWDPQLQREVAIKTMHFSASEAHLNAMLLAEARMVSKLRHANVVPIFDAGEQGGDPYLVFEYVQGPTLADKLRDEGPLDPVAAAAMLRQVVDALTQAHSLGIIHRDLKPSNILIDAAGTPRVMDFGIASQVSDAADAAQQGLMGTPSYLAPEYVKDRIVSPQVDVYAAGLILLEMVTARKVVQGNTVGQILYRILNEEVTTPPGLDEKLADIALKACARDPSRRFADAGQMRLALDQYLGAGSAPVAEDAEAQKQSTLEFLLRRMRHKSDFPALSDSVSAINKLTNSDKESINRLSNTILKDYALTNKILRLVNSAYYRQAGGGNISTVSRAVIVLGFDAIRNIAITVLLFEHLQDKGNARELKEAFLRANLAGLLARDTGQKIGNREAEEAFICALFHNLGQMLAQFYFPEEVETIRILMQQKKINETQASAQVLGLPYEELGIGIARTWGFPPSIPNSMRKLPEGQVRKPATQEETLRVIAGFANEMCDMISANTTPESRNRALKAVADRFSASLQMGEPQIKAVVEKSSEELAQVASILHVNLKQSPFARQLTVFNHPSLTGDEVNPEAAKAKAGEKGDTMDRTLAQTLLNDSLAAFAEDTDLEAGPTHDVEAVLTAGIQDISNSLVDDFSLNDILRIILETMYRAMGFKRVLLCLKDAKAGQMIGRFGFGPDTSELVKKFRFPMTFSPDVFHLAVSKNADILITDIDDAKIADKIPAWYRERIPAKTFALFPLTIKGNPVALIYCDKDKAGDIRIPEKELQLLKTLRNQAVLAIKQAS